MVLFPCFYPIVVIHRNRNFSIAFPLIVSRVLYAIINFPRFTFILLGIIFQAFYSNFPLFSHCFMWYSLIFPMFFSSFSPPLQSPQVQIRGRTRGESIPHRHPIATWYITLTKFTSVRLFYHLISWFSGSLGRSAPRPPKLTLFAKKLRLA